jgi:hypothetical protein
MFLKKVVWWLKRGQYVPFLREICPFKKMTPKVGRYITAITGMLLRVKISEGCFVSDAPPAISRPYLTAFKL